MTLAALSTLLHPLIAAEEWFLEELHTVGLGWGLAIVLLTVLVRLSTTPLTFRQLRHQRELQRHLPELKRLRQRHRADKERLQRETMAYYKKHGINPLAAFIPLLVQIPVFISLYYVMRSEVHSGLFGDDGFLFIPKLTERPQGAVAVVLVVAYAASQLVSSTIAARTLEGRQRALMIALPVLFAGVVLRFPAGLAVYWLTSSLWGLGQRVVIWRAAPIPAPAPEPAPEPAVRRHPPPRRRTRKRRRHGEPRR